MKKNLSAVLLRSTVMPRGIMTRVLAEAAADPAALVQSLKTSVDGLKTDFKAQFDGLQKVVHDFREANDATLKAKADDVVLTDKVNRINTAIDGHRDQLKATQTDIEKIVSTVDGLSTKFAGLVAAGGAPAGRNGRKDPRSANQHLPAYAKAFDTYFRKGENSIDGGERAFREMEVQAALTVGSNPDGGYTVLPEIEQTIDSVVEEISPMRALATVMQIGTAEYKKLVNTHGTASGWVGEQATRPQTAGSSLVEVKFPVMEMYAMPAASQSLLDDSFMDIGAWLAGEVQLEFARQEGAAFVTGDGVLKPRGLVGGYSIVADASYAWGKIGYIASGGAGAFASTNPADCLIDAYHALKAPYRVSPTWVANRKTLGAIRKLKDGQGNYLLNMVLRPEAFVEEILGNQAQEMPDMPDIAANSYSIGVGDFKRGYVIIDRVGIRVLRDPFTAKPYVLFYTTKRVGGGVQNFEAFKLVKFASS